MKDIESVTEELDAVLTDFESAVIDCLHNRCMGNMNVEKQLIVVSDLTITLCKEVNKLRDMLNANHQSKS